MKVLHVIPSLSAAHGGPTQAMLTIERALRDAGVDVETATTDDDGPGRRIARAHAAALAEGAAVRWYFPRTIEFYKASPAFVPWIAREVRRFDVVHIHSLFSFTTPVAAWAARRANVPYVVRPLGTLDRYGVVQRRPWLKALSMRWVERPLLQHAAAVHFTSETEAAEAKRLGWDMRPVVIPLAVDAAAGPPRAFSSAGLRVLFLSRLDPKKNIEGLLDAVAMVRADVSALQLSVAGAGEAAYVAQLKSRADALGIAANVRWLGHVSGEAKLQALRDADVFVLPSFSENFGVAAAEALAAGIPCIVGEGVAIGHDIATAGAGFTVAPDAASIAQGIRGFVAQRAEWASMSQQASRLAGERFSPEAMARALKRLYADILTR